MISLTTAIIVLLLSSLITGIISWHAKNWLGKPSAAEIKLTSELQCIKNEFHNYKQDVSNHFEKTATLFNNMSSQYKNLYEHLLTSSQKLCHPDSALLSQDENSHSTENWQEITMKSNEEKLTQDHNWHPTYLEARDATKPYSLDPLDSLDGSINPINLGQKMSTTNDSLELQNKIGSKPTIVKNDVETIVAEIN